MVCALAKCAGSRVCALAKCADIRTDEVKSIGSEVVGPLLGQPRLAYKDVMGLYLLGASVAGQLLYNWGDDGRQGDYRDP
ncbi:hypothetical protein L1987_06913 [Smallanthus sonchifolius]|uniref:Uncharacterized protein n=1 Tax=Smallanthus sonchifolius TaxID=185202 RepID=A0ACB9JZG0_9ASTR|nr:hypothetical protein L1987_06913 [Smallanthus sonchifolius]